MRMTYLQIPNISKNNWKEVTPPMSATKEMSEYRMYTKPAELHKAVNMLRGMVAGITSDGKISEAESNELIHWCQLHAHLEDRHPFSEILPRINSALEDGILDEDEREDILWLCNNFLDAEKYYDLKTASIQFLHGLIHGIMSDGTLSDSEIKALNRWLEDNSFLRGTYPFDELDSLIHTALADGKVSEDERAMLVAFCGNLIEFKDSMNLVEADFRTLQQQYSIDGVCALDPEILFEDRIFCFTGQAYKGTRSELAEEVERLGGIFRNSVNKKTDYLIVGNAGNPCWAYSCYGRKIEEAVRLRKEGAKVQIINELDFWDAVQQAES